MQLFRAQLCHPPLFHRQLSHMLLFPRQPHAPLSHTRTHTHTHLPHTKPFTHPHNFSTNNFFTYNTFTYNFLKRSILHHLLYLSCLSGPASTASWKFLNYWKKLTCGVIRSFNQFSRAWLNMLKRQAVYYPVVRRERFGARGIHFPYFAWETCWSSKVFLDQMIVYPPAINCNGQFPIYT